MTVPSANAWDVVIAGGGLSGLALAAELSQPEFAHLKIAVLESRSSYTRDKTWSYWDTAQALPPLWSRLAQYRWNQWEVSLGERRHTLTSTTAYASLPSDAFYSLALSHISRAKHVQLLMNQQVRQVQSEPSGVRIDRTNAEALYGHWLAEARPPQSTSRSDWVQHFLGWEIHTTVDCFKTDKMGLMHFDAQETGVNFLYVLPYTARCALVENTWISRAHVHVDDALQLKHMIAKHLQLSAYEIGYQERGALPLLPAQPASAEHVFHLGRSAGCLRASTGFAFANSLWHAHQVADSLRQHIASRSQYAPALNAWRPPAPASRRMDVWMDRVFFQAMEADWPAAPEYFMRMFAHVAPERIVRFMQGSSSALDRLAIMQALPKAPFLRAAWQVR